MKKLGSLLRMTLALVALCIALVLQADLFFNLLPNRAEQARELRKNVAQVLAVQVASLLEIDDQRTLQRTLNDIAARDKSMLSLGIRQVDGTLLLQAGDHLNTWQLVNPNNAQIEQLSVPFYTRGKHWGTFEIAFDNASKATIWRWLTEPIVVLLLFMATAGTLTFGLYIKRALQHLDPSSVIPERVQGAFDAMAEGVVVLDPRGRILLANKAFRKLNNPTESLPLGSTLSTLPWLAPAFSTSAPPPWIRAMSERAANAGHTLEILDAGDDKRRLIVNCAPITDSGGNVRGCLTTFSDVSELHRTNEMLRTTLAELSAAKDEVQLKNEELKRLATRDPMTGCLNRRAFNEEFEVLFQQARDNKQPLSCVMMDIDHFKKVNDTFGHAVGDRVIKEVARKLHDASRANDLVCRYGGEEFCIVVPHIDKDRALAFAERVRLKIEQECAAALRDIQGLNVTVSLGVDMLVDEVPNPPALIDRADQGLYRAKRTGRNRVCLFEPEALASEASSHAATGTPNQASILPPSPNLAPPAEGSQS